MDIGVGLDLRDQLAMNSQREKNDIYEGISTGLEDIVLKINTISEDLWSLDTRLRSSEDKTRRIFKVLEIQEQVHLQHSSIGDKAKQTFFGARSHTETELDIIKYRMHLDSRKHEEEKDCTRYPDTMNSKQRLNQPRTFCTVTASRTPSKTTNSCRLRTTPSNETTLMPT